MPNALNGQDIFYHGFRFISIYWVSEGFRMAQQIKMYHAAVLLKKRIVDFFGVYSLTFEMLFLN